MSTATVRLRVAGVVTRCAASVIDLVIVLIVLGVAYLGLMLASFTYAPRHYHMPSLSLIFSGTATVVVIVVYLASSWTISGRTPGAALMGLEVVDVRGRRIGWRRALLRAVFCTFFGVGLLWSGVDAGRRSVQDIALRTRVVYTREPGVSASALAPPPGNGAAHG
ncbi:hypothetical protein GCM10027169_35710 [Gordonia jinhuaensis]|uniref:RDD domain-containing protein n=1 Tax=Gordonia jinhuaensis TaxID=1517702 RepID=A0A916WS88_9ACTN|nr:RDD family protein [Gordonia jinhuaensis]GGB29757.1 hypothetical protein GCM10011489_17420 [Gordonia jinhuaensis]